MKKGREEREEECRRWKWYEGEDNQGGLTIRKGRREEPLWLVERIHYIFSFPQPRSLYVNAPSRPY